MQIERMHGLKLAYNILTITGFWIPSNWHSEKLKISYRIYQLFIVTCVYLIVVLQSLLLVTRKFDFQFHIDVFFTLFTSLCFCTKGAIFLFRRDKVIGLGMLLRENFCLPANSEEFKMQRRANTIATRWTLSLIVMAHTILLLFFLTPLYMADKHCTLPYQIYVPYDLCDSFNYWFTCVAEYAVLVSALSLYPAGSNVVIGYILQASNQFDFIKHRIYCLCRDKQDDVMKDSDRRMISRDRELAVLKNCVIHHNHIDKFTKAVKETFNVAMIQIYLNSALVISIIIYQSLTSNALFIHRIKSILYMLAMTSEVFLYCWLGNELTLKSTYFASDTHASDWLVLSKEARKMLSFIVLRSTAPIAMNFNGVMNFNLQSFMNIMKLTYSATNVIRKFNRK